MKKPIVIAVVGSQRSGKTTTVEVLTKELTERGYSVAAVKHISEPDFTIDKVGKDTWRFARSGAKTTISLAANEIATIEKINKRFSLRDILQKCKGNNVVFLEGFKKLISKKKNVHKIVVVRSAEEALEAVKRFKPILVFTGPYSTEKLNVEIPYVDVLRNSKKIADIVEKLVK